VRSIRGRGRGLGHRGRPPVGWRTGGGAPRAVSASVGRCPLDCSVATRRSSSRPAGPSRRSQGGRPSRGATRSGAIHCGMRSVAPVIRVPCSFGRGPRGLPHQAMARPRIRLCMAPEWPPLRTPPRIPTCMAPEWPALRAPDRSATMPP
jgi:hypothetical protein